MTRLRSATDPLPGSATDSANGRAGAHRNRLAARERGDTEVVDLMRPGSFVRLRDHPHDLPPFQLIRCRGGRCWVRQQAWGGFVQWEVAHRSLRPVG